MRDLPISNNTGRLELALFSHLYTVAIQEWGLGLTFNQVLNIRKPSPGDGRDSRLSADEERRLLAAVNNDSNPMLGWIVRIALETGMRSPEIMGMRCHEVDLEKRVARLADTKNDSARTAPLIRLATEAFKATLENPARSEDCSLVFFGELGRDKKRRPYAFAKTWGLLKNRFDMPDLCFHDLRYEAFSRLVGGGLSDREVSTISGHKSMQMLKRYTHLRAEDLVGKLDKLSRRQEMQ